jgi:2-polyprenyl-3-methyl-5-hydroxy-6-metoxy-1,4-benzoquinol methylase
VIVTSNKVKPCAICCSDNARFLFLKFGYRVVRCHECSLVYLDHRPSMSQITSFYSSGYFNGDEERKGYANYLADEELLRLSFQRKLEKLERRRRPGTLLDIGCAVGFFLDEARQRGWTVFGQEVSQYAAEIARKNLGDCIFSGHAESIHLPESSVDVVTMWDVIEHLEDPLQVLVRLRRLLKDDGLLVLCTGNIDSWLAKLQGSRSRIYNPPQHLFFYSPSTLSKLLVEAGFHVIDRHSEWKTMSLRYFSYVLACLNSNRATRMLQRMTSDGRLGNITLGLPLVDNMHVYAVKVQPEPV